MFSFVGIKDGPVIEGMESEEVVYAKNQPEYLPLRSLVSSGPRGGVISRWTFTPEQRNAIFHGADVFLEISTGHKPLQPIRMMVSDGQLDPGWVRACLLSD